MGPFQNPRNFSKNISTFPEIISKDENLNFEQERSKLLELLDALDQMTGKIVHPIYGVIEAETAKELFSIHVSYHLKQFGWDFAK